MVDDDRPVQAIANRPDPGLQQTLVVLRRVVLEVLGQVAEPPGRSDRLNDLLAARSLQLGELGLEPFFWSGVIGSGLSRDMPRRVPPLL